MAAPPGFSDLIARKYDIQQQQADSETALRGAQATNITASTPYENALRRAQAFSTTQQGQTLGPLAAASINATNAGIGLTRAQTGLVGAQTGQIGFDTTRGASPEEAANFVDQTNWTQNYGLNGGTGFTPIGGRPGYAAGTASVPGKPQGKPAAKPAQAQAAPATPLVGPNGAISLHGVMAHAMGNLHAAGGATTVSPAPAPTAPAPGQTTTSGSWDASQVQNPAYGQNQNLRRTLGIKAAGGATNVKADMNLGKGGLSMTDYGGRFSSPVYDTPIPETGAPVYKGTEHFAAGTSGVNAKQGKTTVPGKGAPNVDSVPATLAPKEAVLNAGAAQHLGRGTIAALNALGAAKMTQAGMPPETPPTANGVQASAAPKASKHPGAKPIARGAPPARKPQAKAPPPKVAANGKGK